MASNNGYIIQYCKDLLSPYIVFIGSTHKTLPLNNKKKKQIA